MYSVIAATVVYAILNLIVYAGRAAIQPTFNGGTLSEASTTSKFSEPPFLSPERGKNQEAHIHLSMSLPVLHPSTFLFFVRDCIEKLKVNDTLVSEYEYPLCNLYHSYTLDLKDYLNPGENQLDILTSHRSYRAKFDLRVSPQDKYAVMLSSLSFIFLLAYVAYLTRVLGGSSRAWWLVTVFMGGTLLRILYLFGTHYQVRHRDVEPHIRYLKQMIEDFAVPHAKACWECFQPPLYYFLSALWAKVGQLFELPGSEQLYQMQLPSFWYSILLLAAVVWSSVMLFPKEDEKWLGLLFCALVAAFPGLIYLTGQINNDGLGALFVGLIFVFLLRWWQRGKNIDWYIASLILGIGILAKMSTLPMLGVGFGLLALNRAFTWRVKFRLGLITIALVALVSGTYIHQRATETPGGSGILNPRFSPEHRRLPNNAQAFLTFNPAQVLQLPISKFRASRRKHYWEILYHSAFFGTYYFGNHLGTLSILLLVTGFELLILFAIGLIVDLRHNWYANAPCWLSLLILLAAGMAYRIIEPYIPCQDFRFIPFVFVPLAFYILRGPALFPGGFRGIGYFLSLKMVLLCVVFLLLLLAL